MSIDKLSHLSLEELKAMLVEESGTSADSFLRCCKILAEINSRGVSLPQMSRGIFSFYKQVAAGRILPEFVHVFMGHYVLAHAGALTHKQQKDLMTTGKVELVTLGTDGKYVVVEKPLARMTYTETSVAFGPEGMRSIPDQKKVIKERKPTARRSNSLVIRADVKNGEIVIGQVRITPLMLVDAFKELGYKPPTKAR